MYGSCNSMNKAMTNIISRLKEINEIVAACHGDVILPWVILQTGFRLCG